MKSKPKFLLITSSLFLFFLSFHSSAGIYQIVDLGTLGGNKSNANSINNMGQIVGWSNTSTGSQHAVLFDISGNGDNIDLGGVDLAIAGSISDNGYIVGSARVSSDTAAMFFDSSGNENNIQLGGLKSSAHAVNTSQQIVGADKFGDTVFYATLFDSSGAQNNTKIGPSASRATAINNLGVAVGSAQINSIQHAVIFNMNNPNYPISLGTLGGGDNAARSINELGQIVGEVQAINQPIMAALFDVSEGITTLGTLGGNESKANWINNSGQIVGYAYNQYGQQRATLFDGSGNSNNIDLNTLIDPALGWTLTNAACINDKGWIVGTGINPDGYERGFLIIPEPTTLLLFGFGAVLLRKPVKRKNMCII